MSKLNRLQCDSHEEVHVISDEATGLQAIIAIHDTRRGPSLGGTRFWPYPCFEDALDDVLRLSRSMTYKAAAANLDFGGGKAVIIGDPNQIKSDELLEAYGHGIDQLNGRYVTAEDVGSTVRDMEIVRRATPHVAGLPIEAGGSGDPSPATAHGVLEAMKSVANHLWGQPNLNGRRIAIQGVGKVGGALALLLKEEGCELVISDVHSTSAETVALQCGATIVAPDDILLRSCDILAPCALGNVLGAELIPQLKCVAVVGSANDQLNNDDDAKLLSDSRILYVPDFVVNAGGLINIGEELHPKGYSQQRAFTRVSEIYRSTAYVLDTASLTGCTPLAAARVLAEDRLSGDPFRTDPSQ